MDLCFSRCSSADCSGKGIVLKNLFLEFGSTEDEAALRTLRAIAIHRQPTEPKSGEPLSLLSFWVVLKIHEAVAVVQFELKQPQSAVP